MNKRIWQKLILTTVAVLLLASCTGVAFCLYSIDADSLNIDITATVPDAPVVLESITATYSGGDIMYGQALNNSSISVTAHYSDESTSPVAIADCSVSGFSATKLGAQTVTVQYTEEGITVDTTVSVTVVGYFLTGSMNSWNTTTPASTYIFTKNPSNANEVMLTGISLTAGAEFRIYHSKTAWVSPSRKSGSVSTSSGGGSSNFKVSHTGVYDFYYNTSTNEFYIGATSYTYTVTINSINWYGNDGAVLFAYVWNTSGNAWIPVSSHQVSGSNYVVTVTVPVQWTGMSIVRCSSGTTTSNVGWGRKWNQTNDITIPGSSSTISVAHKE